MAVLKSGIRRFEAFNKNLRDPTLLDIKATCDDDGYADVWEEVQDAVDNDSLDTVRAVLFDMSERSNLSDATRDVMYDASSYLDEIYSALTDVNWEDSDESTKDDVFRWISSGTLKGLFDLGFDFGDDTQAQDAFETAYSMMGKFLGYSRDTKTGRWKKESLKRKACVRRSNNAKIKAQYEGNAMRNTKAAIAERKLLRALGIQEANGPTIREIIKRFEQAQTAFDLAMDLLSDQPELLESVKDKGEADGCDYTDGGSDARAIIKVLRSLLK